MEKNQQKLKEHLAQLRKELVRARKLLRDSKHLVHDSNATIRECVKGFRAISETGNTRVADVFLSELDEN